MLKIISLNLNEQPPPVNYALAAQIESELPQRLHHLNYTIGSFALAAAVAVTGSSPKVLWAVVSFAVLIVMMALYDKNNASTLGRLRQNRDRTRAEEATLAYIDRKHHGLFQVIKNAPVFLIGAYALILTLAYYYVTTLFVR